MILGHIETIDTLQIKGDVYFKLGDLKNINDTKNVFEIYNINVVVDFDAYSYEPEAHIISNILKPTFEWEKKLKNAGTMS